MSETPRVDSAFMPYAPAKPVLDVIRRFRERGLPEVVTRQELHRLGAAEGNSDRIQKALQFLRLLDDSSRRTQLFDRLGKASTSEYQGVFAEIVRAAYAPILAIVDPAVDTEVAVNDAFRHYEPSGQRDNMVRLFRALCQEAGLVITAQVERKPRQKKEGGPLTTARRQKEPPATTRGQEPDDAEESLGRDYRLLSALIQQLPRDGKWTPERRSRWLQAFTANIDLLIEVDGEVDG